MRTVSLTFLILTLLASIASAGDLIGGVVAYTDGDVVVIATSSGFTVGELYGGYYALDEGDPVVGKFHSYGFTDVLNTSNQRSARIYVDNYWLSRERAEEWVRDNTD